MIDAHEYVRRPFPVGDGAADRALDGEKIRYLLLPPELSDGASHEALSVEDAHKGHFRELFITWQDQASEGDTLEIGFVEMTAAEFAALPEM